ncbi:unnamed protein product, partial [Bubo scandiacus]
IWPSGTLLLEEAECSGMGHVWVMPSPTLPSLYSPPASQKATRAVPVAPYITPYVALHSVPPAPGGSR